MCSLLVYPIARYQCQWGISGAKWWDTCQNWACRASSPQKAESKVYDWAAQFMHRQCMLYGPVNNLTEGWKNYS